MTYYPHLNDIYITDRLSQRLSEIDHSPVTTIIAPMGYGKTTMVNWWAKRQEKYNMDAIVLKQMIVIDSITDYWSGFCRAFRNYSVLEEQLKTLGYPEDNRSMSMLVELLSDELGESGKQFYFVLDDLYIFHQKNLVPLLLFLSRCLSDFLHIILISRNQIFSAEERMHLGNGLCEISADDLRLNELEVADYAKLCGISAPTEDTKTLAITSEGWISMVYLNFKAYVRSGRWLSGSEDIFTLIDQVLLAPLPERHREFLILNGMADEFSVEQASYLWRQPDTENLIKSLSRNNAFITRNENELYRYHHMLRQCTRQKFSEKPESYQKENLSRLGQWYLSVKEYVLADFAFAKAEDWDGLLISLGEDKVKSLNAEHSKDFFCWLKICPEDCFLRHPSTIVACMVKLFSFNNIPEIYRLKGLLLKSLEQNTTLTERERNDLLGDAEVSESFLCYNNISAMSAYHRRACALLSRTSVSIDSKGAWTFSAPSIFMMYHRMVGGADSENAEMKECMPYFYKVSNGHGNGAEHGFAADMFYERGQFTDADIENCRAFVSAKQKDQFSIMLNCKFLTMRMALFHGKYETIQKIMADCQEWLRHECQYTLLCTLEMCQGFLYALLGHPENAPEWFASGRLNEALVMFPAMPMLHTFYNQLLLSQKQWTAVIARHEECEKLYSVYHNVMCQIWLHIQIAIAFEQLDRRGEAMKELRFALDMALPDEIVMPFVETGEYIILLLQELREVDGYSENIDRILSLMKQFQDGKQKILQEYWNEGIDYGLTERELEIARLAAERKTNLEIAELLHLSEGTIKNQLKRVFDKLGIKGNGRNKRLELEKIIYPQKIHK